MIMEEIEWKWALNAASHQKWRNFLHQEFGPAFHIEQRNRFFDTADGELRKKHMSVRLRQNNQQLVLTLKQKVDQQAGLHQQWEWEQPLNMCNWWHVSNQAQLWPYIAQAMPWPEHLQPILNPLKLFCFGGFDNCRLEWRRDHEHIALDQTTFSSDKVDYELEVEQHGKTVDVQAWQQRALQIGIELVPQPQTKLERFAQTISIIS